MAVDIEPPELTIKEIIRLNNEDSKILALEKIESLVLRYPNSVVVHNLCGVLNQSSFNYERALKCFIRTVTLRPGYHGFWSNLGNLLNTKGDNSQALKSLKKSVILKPDFEVGYNSLGNVFKELGSISNAHFAYKRSLALKPEYREAKYNLGISLCATGRFVEAKNVLSGLHFRDSELYVLRSLYNLNEVKNFEALYNNLVTSSSPTPILGNLGCHASLRLGKTLLNSFCQNPLNFVFKDTVCSEREIMQLRGDGIDDLIMKLYQQQKKQPLLKSGWQSTGNIFHHEREALVKIKSLIETKVLEYRQNFYDSNEGFLANWPERINIHGWIVAMSSGGHLLSHMHEQGWLSGSFYIEVPKSQSKLDGMLKVSLTGGGFPTDEIEYPERLIEISTGDLCLFPSSLFHSTTPFVSDKQRLVLAFDIIPL